MRIAAAALMLAMTVGAGAQQATVFPDASVKVVFRSFACDPDFVIIVLLVSGKFRGP